MIVSSPAQDGAAPASPAESSPTETAVRVPTRDANVWREAAKPWLGTPYRLGGLSREGIDCSGFALTLHHEVTQLVLPRTTTDQWRSLNAVNVSQLRPGDLLYFNTSGKGVSHVGVSLGGEEFVHASTSKGVMFSSVAEPYWAKSFLGVRRP
jgi:cell wall-associated NlpC family hydrolase